ncbi:MAG TPA: SDR family oxidoreductase [Acetivibrio sp.]|jgi:NAD(P)-dependent dehydrogenase (short-subunit alcohol dehydrogenase family)|uniref:3-oxoacyl-[acyl-carrier-protein] reductase FabG n=1 Tax=Acetivibrio saccincola TaxID=1677857 RepID=A0A2K9EJW1_9FIRM|nr:SDR family oxidoreductase [Acetivibrio saccincola]HOA81065.1 SDR family oxidoreductase [Defluviitaleaceae bacterium]HPT91484.1 SDR family oxidoreductase [Acetivibrio sp.]AUG56831.1 3-oxoacyl-[acyl-carrier-protein] reductase FabG [Acetivibrio saccincola]NLW27793.1 SDR family oxidoreductase [Acetivibrio saccincola]PQQ66884.1 hypothetical protein B9R14_09090 [Acetivibrio saccincola]
MPYDPIDIKGKRILVTGASSGIGRETSKLLSQLGALVVLVSRNEYNLENTKNMLDGTGHISVPFDLTNINGIVELVDGIVAKAGPMDGLVHCAGIDYTAPLKLTKYKNYSQLFDLNLFSFIELVKGFTKKDNYSKNGASIVAVSSVMGSIPAPGLTAYAASKAAMDNVVKTFALEFAPLNIRFNTVVAAYVNTEMFKRMSRMITEEQINVLMSKIPLGLGEPADIANPIVFLLSNAAKWITGTNMVVDGGYLLKK